MQSHFALLLRAGFTNNRRILRMLNVTANVRNTSYAAANRTVCSRPKAANQLLPRATAIFVPKGIQASVRYRPLTGMSRSVLPENAPPSFLFT